MMRLREWWVFSSMALMFLALSQNMSAQVASFKHFGLDQSVFPSRIECLEQNDRGELLIGTLAGLVFYDGVTFEAKSVRSGLAESSISTLSSYGDKVYIGHWAGNISVYHDQSDTFSIWPAAPALEYSSIVQIQVLGDDSLLVLTESGKLYSVVGSGAERVAVPGQEEDERVVKCIQRDDEIFLLTSRRFILLASDSDVRTDDLMSLIEDHEVFVDAAYQDQVGWIFLTSQAMILTEQGNNASGFEVSSTIDLNFGQTGFLIDDQQCVWLSTEDDGIYRYDLLNGETKHFTRNSGLSYDQVRSLFSDREGNVWIATAAGLDQFLGDAFQLFNEQSGIRGGLVWDIATVKDKLFVLTEHGIGIGSSRELAQGKSIERFIETPGVIPKQVLYDQNDLIWVLDVAGQLWFMDHPAGALQRFTEISVNVSCLELVDGTPWVGTDQGVFLLGANGVSGRITQQTGLAGNRVTGIYYSKSRNETWITVLGAPVTRYTDGRFKLFSGEEGVTSSVIQDGAFDRDGRVWFATYDKGVLFYDPSEEQFHSVDEYVTLTSNTTFALEFDVDGVLWVGHNWGLDAYDPNKQIHRWYGEDDGFMGVEVNSGAMSLAPDGKIWMGTLMGLLSFDPTQFHVNSLRPQVEIISLMLGSNDLLKNPETTDYLSGDNDLSVTFNSVSLRNPVKNRYYYRLHGVHENWKELDYPQAIEYMSLPPGDFTFELRACNDSEICTLDPYRLTFSIYPPFYSTWWFYTLLFLISIVLIYFMDRYKLVSILEQKKIVEDKLVENEQARLELAHSLDQLNDTISLETKIIGRLEEDDRERSMQACDVLMGFTTYQQALEQISSDGSFCLHRKEYDVVVLLDVGVSGNVAHALRTNLKIRFDGVLPDQYDADKIIREWKILLKTLEGGFKKFKGVNWFIYLKHQQVEHFAADGMHVLVIGDEVVDPFNATVAGLSRADSGVVSGRLNQPIVVCSDGVFTQLNQNGTKSYPMSRLIDVIQQADKSELPDKLWSDIEDWAGGMEQFEDRTIYIWNHD